MKFLCLVIALGLGLVGCSARPTDAWQPDQAVALAWWIEDVAHGLVRDPGEVAFVGAGPRAQTLAVWAAGSQNGPRWEPPQQLHYRRTRWPALVVALSQGDVEAVPGTGLLASAPELSLARRESMNALVDAENDDRRFVDGLVLKLGRADSEVAAAYQAAIILARKSLDLWTGAVPAPR